jgi:hypothetical protein
VHDDLAELADLGLNTERHTWQPTGLCPVRLPRLAAVSRR